MFIFYRYTQLGCRYAPGVPHRLGSDFSRLALSIFIRTEGEGSFNSNILSRCWSRLSRDQQRHNKNHHPIKNSVFVAAGSAAYPQKGIFTHWLDPSRMEAYWLFRSFGPQPHGSVLCEV